MSMKTFKRKAYLWYQPADTSIGSDVFATNGTVLTEAESGFVFNIMYELTSEKSEKPYPWIGKIKVKKNSEKVEYIFVKGLLDTKDVKGRDMTFSYAAVGYDKKDILSQLTEDMNKLGISMSEETQQTIEKFQNKGLFDHLLNTGLIVITLILICTLINKCL